MLDYLIEQSTMKQNKRGMGDVNADARWNICKSLAGSGGGDVSAKLKALKSAIKYHCRMGRNPFSADLFREAAGAVPERCRSTSGGIQDNDRTVNLTTLKYLRSKGCPIDDTSRSAATAAKTGDLTLLKYLCGQGCPMDENTCRWAAMMGNLDCLQYLRSVSCPWDARTIADARSHTGSASPYNESRTGRRGATQDAVRVWARGNGCPEPSLPLATSDSALYSNLSFFSGPKGIDFSPLPESPPGIL